MKPRAAVAVACACCVMTLNAQAAEQKCLVTGPGGELSVRHIQLERASQARQILQRYLDRETRGSRVEECLDIEHDFSSAAGRRLDRETPR